MAKILIVEDERPISQLIKSNLTLVGHTCQQAFDGESAVAAALAEPFDLILLDVMLPGLSGFEVIRRIPKTPVIFVTAKNELSDRLAGLYLGGDDYIVKPFEILELLARVESVLRRTYQGPRIYSVDRVTVDFDTEKVTRDGQEISLTPKEYALLETLILHRNIALSREKLLEMAWGTESGTDVRTVDVHIQHLRTKLGLETRIKTLYRLGYRFEA
ncbi:MAG: response regulator transcription factor [Clostridia bacterium]|nr:response regulator transcription factor [Clostridia bacterium]